MRQRNRKTLSVKPRAAYGATWRMYRERREERGIRVFTRINGETVGSDATRRDREREIEREVEDKQRNNKRNRRRHCYVMPFPMCFIWSTVWLSDTLLGHPISQMTGNSY